MALKISVSQRLTNEANQVEKLIDQLVKEDERISSLNDEPTKQSYSVVKVIVACNVLLQTSWAVEAERKGVQHTNSYSFERCVPRNRFLYSLQSEEEIRKIIVESIKSEAQTSVGKKALSSRAELIRTMISSKNEEEIMQSTKLLVDATSLNKETVKKKARRNYDSGIYRLSRVICYSSRQSN